MKIFENEFKMYKNKVKDMDFLIIDKCQQGTITVTVLLLYIMGFSIAHSCLGTIVFGVVCSSIRMPTGFPYI